MRRHPPFFALLVVTALILAVPAQKKKTSDKNFYPLTGPVVVRTNLMVLDADDKYVEGISEADVKIFENGNEQKIDHFRHKTAPLGLGLVVDTSGSMRLQLDQLIKAAKVLTVNLADGDQGFVIRFVSSDKIELLQPFTSDKRDLLKALDSLYIAGGRTAMLDAISLAVENVSGQEKRTPESRFAIVVLSDGADRASYFDFPHLLSLTERSEVQIFPVFFTADLSDDSSHNGQQGYQLSNAERLANALALRTGGRATIFPKKPNESELLAALKQIMIEVRSQYVVGYTSTDSKRDGLPRKLTVQIKDGPDGKKRRAFFRESFVVPLD
jgi:Ca-activated chloride channel family protein